MGKKLRGVLILLVILKVWRSAAADCSSSCSSAVCDCPNLGLASVPQDLPTTIRNLNLQWNQITTLGQSDFSRYRNLMALGLDNNRINDIQAGTFNSTPQLTILYLNDNKLTNLRADMFTGLGNLEDLRLYRNEISDIQAGTFSSTSRLRDMYLFSNNLTALKSDIFTGLINLQELHLDNNEISAIQAGTFNSSIQLRYLDLHKNKLTNLRFDMFRGLENLHTLNLQVNEIHDIQAGTFRSTPQLRNLFLHYNKLTTLIANILTGLGNLQNLHLYNNQMTTLPVTAYDVLTSISDVRIGNNPWHCDCKMVPFRLRMNESHFFETQITCSQPSNFHGQQLLDIKLRNLISDCEAPTIGRFKKIKNSLSVQGDNLRLVCEASGIPTPDITVVLPSGLNATVESVGRVTVGENGTITIPNVTATDAGLYVCVAANLVGNTFATLLVDIQNNMHTTTNMVATSSPLAFNEITYKPEINCYENIPTLSLPVLLGAIFGSVAGTLIIGGIILTIWCRRNTNSLLQGPKFSVVFNNTNATTTVITNGHDLPQDMSESSNVRNPQHVPRPVSSQFEPHEDVGPPSSDPRPRNAVPSQPAPRQAPAPPKRNNTPHNDSPPLPPLRTANPVVYENIPEHAYQSLTVPRNQPSNGRDSPNHYQSLTTTRNQPNNDHDSPNHYQSLTTTRDQPNNGRDTPNPYQSLSMVRDQHNNDHYQSLRNT